MSTNLKSSNDAKSLKPVWLSFCLGILLMVGLSTAPAQAQATRTWVSGVGDDVNPCSRTAPCKTFAGAISKTAARGEINCLDPGGFGAVTITKSISIICEGVTAGIAASNTNGIVINAAATDIVVLRGLDIDGFGTGLNGIRFLNGAALHVENTIIRNFTAVAPNGWGIQFAPTSQAELNITNSTISNNGSAADGGGILVKGVASNTSRALIDKSSVLNNAFGIRVDGVGAAAGVINTVIRESVSAGNTLSGVVGTTPVGGPVVSIMMDRAAASFNANGSGVIADGANTFIRIGGSTITFNNIGVGTTNGGTALSYKDNQINGNFANDGTPITAVTLQ